MRGLKHEYDIRDLRSFQSHPTWVRGLKHAYQRHNRVHFFVAPYVGAWIETISFLRLPMTIGSRTLRGCVD